MLQTPFLLPHSEPAEFRRDGNARKILGPISRILCLLILVFLASRPLMRKVLAHASGGDGSPSNGQPGALHRSSNRP